MAARRRFAGLMIEYYYVLLRVELQQITQATEIFVMLLDSFPS
jgi:hypothetical protein